MFETIELVAVHGAPPAFVRRQVVEIITPLTQLDAVENSGFGQGCQCGGVRRAQYTATPLDLHVGTTRVSHHGPGHFGDALEQRPVPGPCRRAGIKTVPQAFSPHHADEFAEGCGVSRRAVQGEDGLRLPGKESRLPGALRQPAMRRTHRNVRSLPECGAHREQHPANHAGP